MSKWIGYAVSANCGEPLGCYQGIISEADGTTLTLTKAFRNGFPYPKSQVTLNASDIKDLKIIEEKQKPAQQAQSTISICKTSKKAQKATVCENLQANPSSSGNQLTNNKSANGRGACQGQGPSRSKPIDIQQQVQRNNKNNNNPGSFGNPSSTPKAQRGYDKARRRNEACFGDSIETYSDDFDFEGNLALFDKQREWERMRNSAHKPDLVRQADDVGKYRHDENVLGRTSPAARRAIRIPDELRGPLDYVTDEGVVVPSATPRLRRQLWEGLQRYGLADCAGTLLARATADVALRLVGGGRRLDPRNAHQTPTVVALVGPHRSGAVGICTARLLASHGVRTAVLVGGAASVAAACTPLQKELAAFTLGGTGAVSRLERLPSPDLVLLALYDLQVDDAQDEYSEILEWARSARAAIVALEPPSSGWDGLNVRAAVVGGLPPTLSATLGRVYLADVAPPARLFSELRIAYRPPFGAAPVLALHPSDD